VLLTRGKKDVITPSAREGEGNEKKRGHQERDLPVKDKERKSSSQLKREKSILL